MSAQAVSIFIDELKAVLWAVSDEELAQALSIGKSTLASWRRRGSVPEKVQRDIFLKYGIDYSLISTGKPCKEALNDRLFATALYAAVMKLARQIKEEEIEELASWIADHQAEFRAHILDGAVFNIPDPFSTTAYERVLKNVLSGDLATLETFERLRSEVSSEEGDTDSRTEFPT